MCKSLECTTTLLACPSDIFPSCVVTFLAISLFHLCASAFLSAYQRKGFELELRVWRADVSRVSQLEKDLLAKEKEILVLEKEVLERECERLTREREAFATGRDAQVLALKAELGELQGGVADLTKSKEDAETRMREWEVGFLETEAKWVRERDELQKENALVSSRHIVEVDALKGVLGRIELKCDDQELQIQRLTQAKLDIEKVSETLTEKNVELTDKLSEYRFQLELAQTIDSGSLTTSRPFDFPYSGMPSDCYAIEWVQQTQSADSSPSHYPPPPPPQSPDRYNRSYAKLRGATSKPLSGGWGG